MGGQHLQSAFGCLSQGQDADRAELDFSLDTHAVAAFAVIEAEPPKDRPTFGNLQMKRAVVAHERIEALEAKIRNKDEVLAELMSEHIAIKKSLGEI